MATKKSSSTATADEQAARRFPVSFDPERTFVIVHGAHQAVTMTNHFNPETGNPVIEFSTAPTPDQRKDFFGGRDSSHPEGPAAGLTEIVDGRRVPVRIVNEELVAHESLDGVDSLFVELEPVNKTVLAKPMTEISVSAGQNGVAVVK